MHGTGLAEPPPTERRNDSTRLRRDARWQLTQRIVATKGFAKSSFLTGFLTYVCERHLLQRDDEITEQQIGVQVFGRPVGYNANEDNIVRNYARILRQRLDAYFETEGAHEEIRLVVPRGGYVPIFHNAAVGTETLPAEPEVSEEESPVVDAGQIPFAAQTETVLLPAEGHPVPSHLSMPPHRMYLAATTIALVLLSALLWFGVTKRKDHNPIQARAKTSDIFWNSFFKADQDTFVVPGDSGLAMYEDLTGVSVDLGSYVRADYPAGSASRSEEDLRLGKLLGVRRYTSVVDLKLVSTLSRLPQVNGTRLKIRYARELRLDDLKQSNAILIGSIRANPWVELFQKELNFQFYRDPKRNLELIHNMHPRPGEKEFYLTQEADVERTTYGVIAVVPNLDHTGYVLMMEGINMAGTEGAADFLMSDRATPLLERLIRDRTLNSPFEILIETSNIGANAPEPKMIAERIR